jgi:Arc/MetJ-type ribon-helix-helix transcriptional regulator
MVRINFNIGDKQKEFLEKECEKTGLNQSEIIRRAIQEYIERRERDGK